MGFRVLKSKQSSKGITKRSGDPTCACELIDRGSKKSSSKTIWNKGPLALYKGLFIMTFMNVVNTREMVFAINFVSFKIYWELQN